MPFALHLQHRSRLSVFCSVVGTLKRLWVGEQTAYFSGCEGNDDVDYCGEHKDDADDDHGPVRPSAEGKRSHEEHEDSSPEVSLAESEPGDEEGYVDGGDQEENSEHARSG